MRRTRIEVLKKWEKRSKKSENKTKPGSATWARLGRTQD